MNLLFAIEKKRDGEALTEQEIHAFVSGFVAGEIPDYLAAALCMAICIRGMTDDEAAALTLAMVETGQQLDIAADLPEAIEQHSTGCVGDGVDLTLLPLLASAGLQVTKIAPPGLGFITGITDKVASIPGMRTDLDRDGMVATVAKAGMAVALSRENLVPADAKLYALRDVSGTVRSVPLIAASILSKKLATGTRGMHLTLWYGRGAFLRDPGDARHLGQLMTGIAANLARTAVVPVLRVDQPLGGAIGSAVELRQALEVLDGGGPEDLREHALYVGTQMLGLGGVETDPDAADARLRRLLADGAGLERFGRWVEAQGGDPRVTTDRSLLPAAPVQATTVAGRDGWLTSIDPYALGEAVRNLGGGRRALGDEVDPAVGLSLHAKAGTQVEADRPLFTVHARDDDSARATAARVLAAYNLGDDPVAVTSPVREDVFGTGNAV